MNSALIEKGRAGEQALHGWLNDNGFAYLYINQNPETFASLFQGTVKRPDFLVLVDSIGLIAVDVKNYTLSGGVYTLQYEEEVCRTIAFERMFRIPVWYAYLAEKDGEQVWYWISALKALEVGVLRRQKGGDKKEFLAIPLDQFCEITRNDDFGKLYTQRQTSMTRGMAGLAVKR